MMDDFHIDFIGIGAQKSATTWIYKCLVEHPAISMCEVKETHFFNDNSQYDQGIEKYYEYFNNCDFSKVVGEYSTLYIVNPAAAARIKKYFPAAKMIASLRQPVDRAIAHIEHFQSKGMLPEKVSVKEAVKKYPEIIEHGLYGQGLKRFFELFPKEQFLIILHDEIKNNPQEEMRRIYDFLGVDKYFIPQGLNKKYHTNAVRKTFLYQQMNKYYFKLAKRNWGRKMMAGARQLGINSYLLQSLISKVSSPRTYTPTTQEKEYLRSFFTEDIKLLQKLINKDLTNWFE